MKTYIDEEIEDNVFSIQADAVISGNLLFADGSSLKTTNGTITHEVTGIAKQDGYVNGAASEARFNSIRSFVQMMESKQVIIVDAKNHCLRLLNRTSNQTSDYAGKCEEIGTADGIGTAARLTAPCATLFDPNQPNLVYFSDHSNGRIRRLNTTTVNVISLGYEIKESQFITASFAWPTDTYEYFLVPSDSSILKYELSDVQNNATYFVNTSVPVGSSRSSLCDGQLADARLGNLIGIVAVSKDVYLVSEGEGNKLRLVDTQNETIMSICNGEARNANGSLEKCSLNTPLAISLIDDVLYIGTVGQIKKLSINVTEEMGNNGDMGSGGNLLLNLVFVTGLTFGVQFLRLT